MSKQIAFSGQLPGSRLRGGAASGPNLYAIHVEDNSVRQLTADLPVGDFAWSPDGQRLAFLSSRYTAEKRIETLYLLEADGGHLRRLTGDYGGITWNWSPDGRQLAFTCFEEDYRSPQRHGKLHIMDLERETVRQVTEDTTYPAWSRETNELAFLWSYDAHHVFRMDANGANRQVLFHSDLVVSPYGRSPDNQLLACYRWSRSHWGTEYEDSDTFHVVDAQGNLVVQEGWGASALAWSPDSRHIACIAPFEYHEDEEEQEQDFVESHDYLYLLARDGSSVQPLAPTTYEVGIGWSPDSQKIAFILDDDHRYTLGVMDLVSQKLRSYPMEGKDNTAYGVRPNTPVWSPDSQQIAYSSLDLEHIFLIELNGTAPRCLTRTLWDPSNQERQAQGNGMVEHSFISKLAWQP